MSLLASMQKKSKLETAIKQINQAIKEPNVNDVQLKQIYQTFAEVVADDLMRAQALYNWGAALLYQGKTKTNQEAITLYKDAVTKFEFCLLMKPDYLAAANDSGVALMDLARLQNAVPDDVIYNQAKNQFELANSIQAGSGSYNLACIYSLQGNEEACLQALQEAKSKGSLPDEADILNDPDMAAVKELPWFAELITSLSQPPEAPEETPEQMKARLEEEEKAQKKAAQKEADNKYYS